MRGCHVTAKPSASAVLQDNSEGRMLERQWCPPALKLYDNAISTINFYGCPDLFQVRSLTLLLEMKKKLVWYECLSGFWVYFVYLQSYRSVDKVYGRTNISDLSGCCNMTSNRSITSLRNISQHGIVIMKLPVIKKTKLALERTTFKEACSCSGAMDSKIKDKQKMYTLALQSTFLTSCATTS